MVLINNNERSWAIDVIIEINNWANERNVLIKRAGGESTLSSNENKKLFPDVLLYGDSDGSSILQGWELKLPDTPIDDNELINNACKKSKILGLDSFLIWNVKSAVLYKREDNIPSIIYRWDELSNKIKNREDVFLSKDLWKKLLYIILDDLILFFKDKKINYTSIINSLTNEGLSNFILNNTPSVADKIKEKIMTDSLMDDNIIIWWMSVKNEYEKNADMYTSLAKIVLVSWMNKLIFANLLKQYHDHANEVENIVDESSLEEGIIILRKISDKCDFKNIFSLQLAEDCVSNIAWKSIKLFNKFLIEIQLNKLDHESIQKVLINTVKKTSKKISGQFTTPYNLSIFLSTLIIKDKTKAVLDPCCGTGTLINASYDLKLKYGVDEKEAIDTIWASDKFAFPLQLAMLAMTNPKHIGEVIKIFKEDVINLADTKYINFNDPNDGSEIKIKFPKFYYIISNLPFVQKEDIYKLKKGIKNKISSKIKELTGNNQLGLNDNSDLYSYIPFSLWEILEFEGKLGIITSNSWLGTLWGNTFYNILHYFYDIQYVITSSKGLWFKDANVVTTILILKKREKNKINCIDKNHKTNYITLNIDINKNGFTEKIDEICALIRRNQDSKYFNSIRYSKLDEEKILKLGLSKNTLFEDVSWIIKIEKKLIKAQHLFDIGRGERRGWNAMFYPNKENNIEKEYIKSVIKTPKEIEGYVTKAKSDAFCCEKSIDELTSLNHKNALNWIKKFENELNKKGKPLPEVLKKANVHWYTMKPDTIADICTSINPEDRLFFSRLKECSFVDQRLIRFTKKDNNTNIKLCSALLNSIIGIFYIESLGFGRGLGALDLNSTNMEKNLFMLNPNLLNDKDISEIISKYEILEKRDVYKIEEELCSKDRKNFDFAVLSAFRIEEYHDKILNSLLKLYKRRKTVKK